VKSLRQIFGWISRVLSPGYSGCLRCGMSWLFTRHHITRYSFFAGCFPLCEHCWRKLTVDQRLRYYHGLVFEEWDEPDLWDKIRDAVIDESASPGAAGEGRG
jgi:hypothetical protein